MTGCVAIARPNARRSPFGSRHTSRLPGMPDLHFRMIAGMPAPSRNDRKDTANAVGS
jgi:hypothetical protein